MAKTDIAAPTRDNSRLVFAARLVNALIGDSIVCALYEIDGEVSAWGVSGEAGREFAHALWVDERTPDPERYEWDEIYTDRFKLAVAARKRLKEAYFKPLRDQGWEVRDTWTPAEQGVMGTEEASVSTALADRYQQPVSSFAERRRKARGAYQYQGRAIQVLVNDPSFRFDQETLDRIPRSGWPKVHNELGQFLFVAEIEASDRYTEREYYKGWQWWMCWQQKTLVDGELQWGLVVMWGDRTDSGTTKIVATNPSQSELADLMIERIRDKHRKGYRFFRGKVD